MILPLFENCRTISDKQLMGRVRETSDERAFDELYRRYARLLQGFFFRRLGGNEELAADLLQDTFLRVWTARKQYAEEQNFRTWLFTIAYNLCKNAYRTNMHAQAYLDTLPMDEAVEDDTPLRLDDSLFDHALQQELARLNEVQQMLFELRFTQELTVPEIAAVLEIPEGTVKSRLHNLTQYLRLRLKEYE